MSLLPSFSCLSVKRTVRVEHPGVHHPVETVWLIVALLQEPRHWRPVSESDLKHRQHGPEQPRGGGTEGLCSRTFAGNGQNTKNNGQQFPKPHLRCLPTHGLELHQSFRFCSGTAELPCEVAKVLKNGFAVIQLLRIVLDVEEQHLNKLQSTAVPSYWTETGNAQIAVLTCLDYLITPNYNLDVFSHVFHMPG